MNECDTERTALERHTLVEYFFFLLNGKKRKIKRQQIIQNVPHVASENTFCQFDPGVSVCQAPAGENHRGSHCLNTQHTAARLLSASTADVAHKGCKYESYCIQALSFLGLTETTKKSLCIQAAPANLLLCKKDTFVKKQ